MLEPDVFTKEILLQKLVSDAAPPVRASLFLPHYQTQHFSQVLYGLITGFSNYGINILGDRYVSFAGCVPHDCGLRGFIWVDATLGTNIMVLLSIDLNRQNLFTYNLTISSNYYTAYNVPQTAKIAVLNWSEAVMGQRNNKKINFSRFKSLRFYDVVNKHLINLDSNW